MRASTLLLLLGMAMIAECNHMFVGTNFLRPRIYQKTLIYNAAPFKRRLGSLNYTLPLTRENAEKYIQGIMAYDLMNSGATINVIEGGIGYNFVKLRLRGDVGGKMKYDLNIYA